MDLQNNISAKRLISPIAAGTTGTGKTSAPSLGDRQGYGGVEIIFEYGTLTATNATVTVTVLEGDVTGTMTSVADADLIGVPFRVTVSPKSLAEGKVEFKRRDAGKNFELVDTAKILDRVRDEIKKEMTLYA
jgi:hypothetical protein